MLQININKDENLQDACNIFISALLPHDRYNATYYTEILQTLFRYVRLEEFSGPYYVLLKILTAFLYSHIHLKIFIELFPTP